MPICEIAARWSVTLHERSVGRLLHRLALTRLQPRPYHPKKDAAAQAAFEKKLPSPGSRGGSGRWQAGRNLVPDEARVGQKASLEYIWAPVGSRPPMVRDNRHDPAYLFGAVCHARHVGAAIIMPTVNAEAMAEHLKEISAQVAAGAHAVVVCDGAAGTNRSDDCVFRITSRCLPLSPYSPELNPMENIWDYLRGNKLNKRIWDSYEAILAA